MSKIHMDPSSLAICSDHMMNLVITIKSKILETLPLQNYALACPFWCENPVTVVRPASFKWTQC